MIVTLALAVQACCVVAAAACRTWLPRVGRPPGPVRFPDAAHVAAVRSPRWRPDPDLPRPLAVALVGLRAAGCLPAVGPEQPGAPDQRPLSAWVTQTSPDALSSLARTVHSALTERGRRDDVPVRLAVMTWVLAADPRVVAALDGLQRWAESNRLVVPARRFVVATRLIRLLMAVQLTAALGAATGFVVEHGRDSPGAAGLLLLAVVSLFVASVWVVGDLDRVDPTTPAGRLAVAQLRQERRGAGPPAVAWHRSSRPAQDPDLLPHSAVVTSWMLPAGWTGYREGEAEWAEALHSRPPGPWAHPQEWSSVGLTCDPWFCVRAQIHVIDRGSPPFDPLLRRVATGGPDGEPGVPDGAFAVVDTPSYVPANDIDDL